MAKEVKLVNKVKRLLRHLGYPRWLHHYGPKKYEFLDHLLALLLRSYCRLAYRRTKALLDLLGIKCPTKSSLQRTAKKLDCGFWQKVLKATSGNPYLIAIDSTGFSRTSPSYHYLKRIDCKMPKVPVKLSVAFDTKNKKYCAAKIRVLPAHDIKDATSLIKQSKPTIIVADKAYDANSLHIFCRENNIKAHIPLRKCSKPRHGRWSARLQAAKQFRKRTYHRREMVESGNSSIKRKYGSSVSSKTARTIRTEVYGRLACHNIFFWILRLSGQSQSYRKVYKSPIICTPIYLFVRIRFKKK